jgi:hypothetical protein
MANQRYAYTTHQTRVRSGKVSQIEDIVNEYAREGWRLSETLASDGSTVALVFERRMDTD